MEQFPIRIGTAGWGIPAPFRSAFAGPGPMLERYALQFQAVEINSSFHRCHRPGTFSKWASLVPDGFRFAVKAPRDVTHLHRLGADANLVEFLGGIAQLGPKLGPVLLQLPPSLAFEASAVGTFLDRLRDGFDGLVVVEPRHPSWFTAEGDRLLRHFQVARVAADPKVVPQAGEPGGWEGLVYFRLHGSPVTYKSAYSAPFLERLASVLRGGSAPAWCIFDNTTLGEALGNGLELVSLTGRRQF